MKKHVAQPIVESAPSWASLSVIELNDEEYGVQGTLEELFSSCSSTSIMLILLNSVQEYGEIYYECLEIVEAFENIKHAKVGHNDVWY